MPSTSPTDAPSTWSDTKAAGATGASSILAFINWEPEPPRRRSVGERPDFGQNRTHLPTVSSPEFLVFEADWLEPYGLWNPPRKDRKGSKLEPFFSLRLVVGHLAHRCGEGPGRFWPTRTWIQKTRHYRCR